MGIVKQTNAINLSMDSNSKAGTSSTAMNVSEAQSAFGGKSHEARPQECFLTKPSQRTVKTIGAESNQSCDQLEPTLKNALVLYNAGYDSHQSCDQLVPTSNNALVPTLNNALVLYTGEQSRASVLTLQNPDAERILLIEKINDTVEWQNWEKLNTLLNSEISSDLTERELMNVYEKIYVQEGLKCSGIRTL